jgi:2-amino-4-hydroxy-6-hydroxymethyldihydropteridine diphosphokinase
VGDGGERFAATLHELDRVDLRVLRCSDLYETEPWGGAGGSDYTNAVMEIARRGPVHEFWRDLQSVESALGRVRRGHYGPRTCDLDLLLWGSETVDSPELTVPHPRLAERRFVLHPLCDLIPHGVHPILKKTFRELLDTCPDVLRVRRRGALNL